MQSGHLGKWFNPGERTPTVFMGDAFISKASPPSYAHENSGVQVMCTLLSIR